MQRHAAGGRREARRRLRGPRPVLTPRPAPFGRGRLTAGRTGAAHLGGEDGVHVAWWGRWGRRRGAGLIAL